MVFRYFNIGSIPPQPASQHPLYEHEIEMKCCEGSAVIGQAGGPSQPPPRQPRSNISDRFSFSQNVSYELGKLRLAGVKLIYTEHNSLHFILGKPLLLLSFSEE